ncbi:unnamed protein product [Darwinula stevensoni]|uniref:CWF19-like protein 2 n=1 Tax=Darwinula stevensoni TaxID=69355 RepID=A0A7R8WYC4_9CRUS|nr:unnamed protein product [Darwinula stevensoni]CAG0879170.1 unnamed protein product [Darwinula stevensoni]
MKQRQGAKKRQKDRPDPDSRNILEKPGQHTRELNPYWKDGGTGLPKEEKQAKRQNPVHGVGDNGVSWIRRAYQRAVQQAQEEGVPLEEIARRRWGSLEKLEELLARADGRESRDAGKRHESMDQLRMKGRKYEKGWKRPGDTSLHHHLPKKTLQEAVPEVPQVHGSEKSREDDGKACKVTKLTESEKNTLGAKIIKAEIMGNKELARQLQAKLDEARKYEDGLEGDGKEGREVEVVKTRIVSRVSGAGPSRRVKQDTHDSRGDRVRYFADDAKHSLHAMFEREKRTEGKESDETLLPFLAGKSQGATREDFDVDDLFVSRISDSKLVEKEEQQERKAAARESLGRQRAMESCRLCFDSPRLIKHLVVAMGKLTVCFSQPPGQLNPFCFIQAYLSVPGYASLVEGQCIISSLQHVSCCTTADEDVWAEIQDFAHGLVRMYEGEGKDVVFFESAMGLKHFPHLSIHCIPLQRELADLAPMYFKKAILECEQEWSQNRKLVDLKGKDVRHRIPKGLPYFFVRFNWKDGFAHVIEDERLFPQNFAQEILGGMLELEPTAWRKPQLERESQQWEKALSISKKWEPHDFTREILS